MDNTNSQFHFFCVKELPYVHIRSRPSPLFFNFFLTLAIQPCRSSSFKIFLHQVIQNYQGPYNLFQLISQPTTPSTLILANPVSIHPSPPASPPCPPQKEMSTRPTYKFKIHWPQSGVVIIKGGFASFDAALNYSIRVNSFGSYYLPECDELGLETSRYKYRSRMWVEDVVCVVLVGPEGMNMDDGQ